MRAYQTLPLVMMALTAAATSPLPPWETHVALEGEPTVGADVTLVASIQFHSEVDTTLTAQASGSVMVLDGAQPLRGASGDETTLSWRLRVDEAGPWNAGLDFNGSTWCCLRGWSTATEGNWAGPDGEPPWPRPTFTFDLQTELVDDATVRLIHTATATGWAADGEVHVTASHRGDPGVTGAGSPAASVTQTLALADGGGAVITRQARVDWPLLYDRQAVGGTCENIELERNGGVRPIDAWSCEASATRNAPAPAAWALFGLLAAVLASGRGQRQRESGP